MVVDIGALEERVAKKVIKKYISEDGEYIGWNYTDKCQYEKAWDEHTISSRGIVTLKDGTVISRPFPKFFNLGEPEAQPIPWGEDVEVSEKLDGSLIVVSFHNGKMIVNSRGSFTSEHAEFARNWIAENMGVWAEAKTELSKRPVIERWTYLFEAIFPETVFTKLTQYGTRADLTLLAVVNVETGEELAYSELIPLAQYMNVGLVQRYVEDINDLIAKCKARRISDGEGIVIHFRPSNKRIKVKSDEYVRLNRLVSHTSRKHVLEALIKGDDVESIYSALPDEMFEEVKKYISEIKEEYATLEHRAKEATDQALELEGRKARALFLIGNPGIQDIQGIVFTMLDKRDHRNAIWKAISNHMRKDEIDNEPRLP
jgi:RNA ligase